jgi:membrane protein YqaA with SNARE-associated domain
MEIFAGKEHAREPVTVKVVKRPMRVLLFASAATGFPPFYAVSVLAGVLRLALGGFVIAGPTPVSRCTRIASGARST